MGRITTGIGLVSGINTADIIDQLMKLESQPKDRLTTRISKANERKLAYTDLTTRLSGLRITSQSLKKPSTFQAAGTTSSDEDVLTATASAGAAVGTYQFQVARLVTTQQAVSGGFADFDQTAVGATTLTIEQGGGELTSQTALSQLRGGAGVRRGLFRITDRSGNSAVIDATAAVTLDDVVKKINTSLDVSVRAKVSGDRLVLTDLTGKTASNFIVQDLGDGKAAADLGIVANAASDTVTGADINFLGGATLLEQLNDGRGVRTAGGTTADLRVTLKDNTTLDISLGSAKTVGDVIAAINAAGGAKLKADVPAGGNGIRLTDTSGGPNPRPFAVTALNGSKAAADLGIVASGTATVINGGPVIAGLNTVLVSSLRGGIGLPLGQVRITDRSGAAATVDLSGAKTVQDILDTISNAAGVAVTAGLKPSANGIQITDDSGGTGDLVIADLAGGTTAAMLGVAGTHDTSKAAVLGANLQRQWVTENTTLASYNGGRGVAQGSFTITNSAGRSARIDLSDGGATRLKDVIARINAAGIGVTASVNDNGDGLLLTDVAGGAGKLKVEELDSTTAADLNIKGTALATEIDGSFERTITIDADDTLGDVQTKINELGFGVTASVINDGSGASPFRLSLSARNSGRNGRVVFDAGAGAPALQTRNLVESQDAAVFLGSADVPEPLLVTAGGNQLAGVVRGVTIDLHNVSEGPVTLSVTRSVEPLVETFTKFAEDFNALADKLKELTSYDPETNKRGLLLGESAVQTVETNLYAMFTGVVRSAGRFRVLADVGLKLGDGAKLQFDEAKFRAAYAEDPDAVEALFATAPPGLTAATRLATLNNGRGIRTAAAGGADLSITVKDGTTFQVSLAGAEDVGDVIDAINAAGAGKITAEADEAGGRLRLTDNTTTGTATFRVQGTNGSLAAEDLGIRASGSAGVITGGRVLSATSGPLPSGGVGIAYLMERRITQLIDPVDGTVTRTNKALDEQTRGFQGRIDALDKLLTRKRERLERQFAQMESVLANLQTQQQALGSFQGLAPLPARSA